MGKQGCKEHIIRRSSGIVALAHRVEQLGPSPMKSVVENLLARVSERMRGYDTDPSFALDKLECQMMLIDPDKVRSGDIADDDWERGMARRNIGAVFYALHLRQGLPVPARAQDNGYVTPPNPDEILARMQERERRMLAGEPELTPEQRDWLDRARYKALLNAARWGANIEGNSSRNGQRLIINVCIGQRMPAQSQLKQLLDCLDRMRDAKLPSARDVPELADLSDAV